jgi:Spy/CpxP family protein refolding chaperone
MARNWLMSLAFLCAFGLSATTYAQPSDAPAKRAELEHRLKKLRAEILRKDVGLDEKKATEVERTLDKFRAERERLQNELRQQQKTLRALLDLDSVDQSAYARSLQIVREHMQKLQVLRLQEFDELAKLLTPKQQAKLGRAIRQLEQKLKALVRRHEGEGDDD